MIMNSISVFGYGANEHNKILIEVLFGKNPVTNTDAIEAINDAVAISIDHFNGDNSSMLIELKNNFKIRGLPDNLSSINFNGNSYTHRQYTHKGWTYDYSNDGSLDKGTVKKANFAKRKDILLKTVNQVFDFNFWSGKLWLSYDKQCDSFAAFVYYVHILGDYIHDSESDSKYTDYGMIPLIESDGMVGMIDEIEKYSKILFSEQSNGVGTQKRNYMLYLNELDEIRSEVEKIYNNKYDLDNNDIYVKYMSYAKDLMDCLKEYIPSLIKEETFFKNVFYQ